MIRDYFDKMCVYKYQICYLNECFRFYSWINRIVLIITAVASSAAIAAWATWSEHAFAWGIVIVVSQLISAVYEILPIKKKTDSIFALVSQLDVLYKEVESTWREIHHLEKYSAEDINKFILEYEKRWTLLSDKEMNNDMPPQFKWMEKKAFDQANKYIVNRLEGEPLNEPSKR